MTSSALSNLVPEQSNRNRTPLGDLSIAGAPLGQETRAFVAHLAGDDAMTDANQRSLLPWTGRAPSALQFPKSSAIQSATVARTGPRWLDSATTKLWEVVRESGVANWDGEGAAPLHPGVAQLAIKLMRALPDWSPEPEIGADRDGDIALDWNFGRSAILSVSIGTGGVIHYAAVFGDGRLRGRDRLERHVPPSVIQALRKVTDHGSRANR